MVDIWGKSIVFINLFEFTCILDMKEITLSPKSCCESMNNFVKIYINLNV